MSRGCSALREKSPFELLATAAILEVLAADPVFGVLDPGLVRRRPVRLGEAFELLPGLEAELFAVPGKVPLYLEGDDGGDRPRGRADRRRAARDRRGRASSTSPAARR